MNLSPLRQERDFQSAYERHVGDVYRYALAVLSDPSSAEEVTYTTFRNAHWAFRSANGAGPDLNVLLAIAHEVCRVRGGYERLAEADFVGADELTTAADVRRALGRLPFDQRAVLVMREVERRKCREIAEIATAGAPLAGRSSGAAAVADRKFLGAGASLLTTRLARPQHTSLPPERRPGRRRRSLLRLELGWAG